MIFYCTRKVTLCSLDVACFHLQPFKTAYTVKNVKITRHLTQYYYYRIICEKHSLSTVLECIRDL